MLIAEDIALLEQRLTSTQSQAPSNILHHMIDDIDAILKNSNTIVPSYSNDNPSENEIKKLKLLKTDLIQQAIIISRRLAEN